jgi:hypothetical protein
MTDKVDRAVDENELCSWCQDRFDKLHISVPDGEAKYSFVSTVENVKLNADK